ncbi:MAG: TetR/AcrR family transcriptional regulator [Actinobacteria bacterium]|nr:TetR/AcrR family transcriptional regulator [Actinomycetota bacterium]
MNKSRWEEILAVSARLFREKGYRATTMDDIAYELNVTKPALYYYIKTKHDLLYAVIESAVEQLIEGAQRIMEGEGGVEEKLRRLIAWHVNMFSENSDFTTVYLAEESELPEDKRRFIRDLSRKYQEFYRQLLREGMEQGIFRDMDIPMVVRAISGMCNWLFDWYRRDGKYTTDEIADIFYDIVMKGCLKEPGERKAVRPARKRTQPARTK